MHGLSLLGVVMGYYFGRSPVERRAESAEKAVDKERSQAEKHAMVASAAMESQRISEGKLLDTKMTLEHAKAALTTGTSGSTGSTGSLSSSSSEARRSEADAPADSATCAYQLLDQLQRRL